MFICETITRVTLQLTPKQILIFDLKSGAKPFRPAPKSNRIEDVTALAWNQIADYILAVGSNNGSTAVYDLRGKREIMKLAYPGGRKVVTGIAWHPNSVGFPISFFSYFIVSPYSLHRN